MKIRVKKSSLGGEISVPGSKSHTIRAVAVALAAGGTSKLLSPLVSGDTLSALGAAESLGAEIEKKDGEWLIKGTGGNFKACEKCIDMGNSGTSLRVLSGLAATSGNSYSFDGDASLRTRPMGQLLGALEKLGVEVESSNGKCPISLKGPIRGGETEIEGTSSQFLTSLLFACPLAPADTVIRVMDLNERPYVEMTLDWLGRQGIEYSCPDDFSEFRIKGSQSYRAFERVIPADFSTATFPLAAAAATQSSVTIRNLDFSDRQGDKAVFDYFRNMGISVGNSGTDTKVSYSGRFEGYEIDLNATPDALPAMAAAACFADGRTSLVNVPQARIKETDRIECMTAELRKMGADIFELDDGMVINGGRTLHGAEVEGHDDHRIVMALALAGMAAEGETVINGAEAAAVTYPDFIADFRTVGADIEIL